MRILYFLIFTSIIGFSQTSKDKAIVFLKQKHFEKAQIEMINYLKQYPIDNDAMELLGDAYGFQKKWDEAIKQYELLIEKDVNNANYQYKYGGALGMKALSINKFKALGIIGDVKKAFLKAAELDPKHIDARWALVELYMSLPGIVGGSKSKALKFANELEKLSTINGYLAKGYIYEYDDEPELAEKYYTMAIKIANSVQCYEKLIYTYPGEELDLTINSKEAKQRNAMHYQIGKVCADYNLKLEKGEKCLKAYLNNHSSKDGVPKAWAYFRLAQIYKHKKNKSEALKWIDKAITNLPKIKVFKEEKLAIQDLKS